MADKKTNTKDKDTKKEKPAEKKEEKPKNLSKWILIGAAIIVIAVAAFILFSKYQLLPTVPFSTFKSTFQSASRVSITTTYSTQAQFANESLCFTNIIQSVSHTRRPSTIDFYIINNSTNKCTYSSSGLGTSVNPITTNSSYCLSKAYSEDGIFLNFSNTNSTTIYANRMFVTGNGPYFAQCQIAVEFS